jgi:hypothetical protein
VTVHPPFAFAPAVFLAVAAHRSRQPFEATLTPGANRHTQVTEIYGAWIGVTTWLRRPLATTIRQWVTRKHNTVRRAILPLIFGELAKTGFSG